MHRRGQKSDCCTEKGSVNLGFKAPVRRWDPEVRKQRSAVQDSISSSTAVTWMKPKALDYGRTWKKTGLGSPSDLISPQWPHENCSMHWLTTMANKGPLGVLVPKPTWRETILLKIWNRIQHILTATLTSSANTTRPWPPKPLGQDGSVKSTNTLQMADYTLSKNNCGWQTSPHWT